MVKNSVGHDPHFPHRQYIVYCPFCEWFKQDSMVTRKRLGLHIVEKHSEEVLYHKDEDPPELEFYDDIAEHSGVEKSTIV